MEPLQRLLAQLRTFWSGLGTVRKVLIVGVTVIIFAGLTAFAILSSSSAEYRLLFSNLPLEDVQPIITRLQAQNISYKLNDSGDGILIPADKLATARVALAADGGIPFRGGKGYEIFDETSLGSTPFVQNVNYQRALQAELARSIMQLEPVQTARVLIAKPEPTPFIRDQRTPTASVVLTLKSSAILNRATAASIVSLVARSVDGLKPEHVTVVDSSGRLLSDPHASEREDLPAAQIEYRRELENYLASKAEEVLSSHLGRGRAVVKVSANINFQKVKEHRETYSPEEKVTSAERLTTSESTSPGRASGVAGARSNIAPAGGTSASSTTGSSKEEIIQTDYNVSRTVRDIEGDKAALQRLDIAALVDLSPPEGGTPTGATLTLAEAEAIIQRAVGFTTGRDEIKVSNVRLGGSGVVTTPPAEDEAAQFQRIQSYVSLARNLSLALAVVMAVALIPLTLLRRRPRPAAEPAKPAGPTPEQQRQQQLRQLAELARNDPDRVADVLKLLAGVK